MKFGVIIFATDYAIPIDRLAELCEDREIESLFVPEHPAIPVERTTKYPPGEPLPAEYWHIFDPFIALAFAAKATTRLKLGTGICLIPEREPIVTAKAISTLDLLSNGRVILGIGGGWLGEEGVLFGTEFQQRWSVTRDRVLAMKRLWTEEEPEYHGKHVDFPKLRFFPKPVQKPHPPILIGASSRWARQRVVDWADGWMPNFTSPSRLAAGLEDIRRRAEAKGRDMSTIAATAFGVQPDLDLVRAYADAGAERVICVLPPRPEPEVVPLLDRWAALAGEFKKTPA